MSSTPGSEIVIAPPVEPLIPEGEILASSQYNLFLVWATINSPSFHIDCHVIDCGDKYSAAVNLPHPCLKSIHAFVVFILSDKIDPLPPDPTTSLIHI